MAFDFSKIKGKKVEKDSTKAEALKNVLGGISSDASKKIAGGLKKVTVASGDKEGLKAGLDKAKELVEKEPMGVEDSAQEEGAEGSAEKVDEVCQMADGLSKDEIHEVIAKLQEKLAME